MRVVEGKDTVWSLPIIDPDYQVELYVRIEAPLFTSKSNPKICWLHVVDIKRLEEARMKARTVLANALLENYEDDSYVGKCFLIVRIEPEQGKNYECCKLEEFFVQGTIFVKPREGGADAGSNNGYGIYSRGMPKRQQYEALKNSRDQWSEWYHEVYLKRTLWKKTIKPRILARDLDICFRCGGRAELVHHRGYHYEVMIGEADEHLVSICGGCHEIIHFTDTGTRRAHEEEENVLLEKAEDRIVATAIAWTRTEDRKVHVSYKRMPETHLKAFHLERIRALHLESLRKARNPSKREALRRLLHEAGMNDEAIKTRLREIRKQRRLEKPS